MPQATLHRAAHLARENPDARVLLTTFSDTLANAMQTKLRRLLGNEPRLAERIDVHSLNAIGLRLYRAHVGQAMIASRDTIRELMHEAATAVSGHKFGQHFLLSEWEQVVDAWQLQNWEGYRDVVRLGRKTRLPEAQRKVAWSIFNGPPPTIHSFENESEEIKTVGNWIREKVKAGVLPHEFGVFVRSEAQLDRALAAAKEAGMAFKVLDEHVETASGHVSIGTMHLAKGLEFRAVVVMACDDEIIPLQERIETVGDDADLQEVYDTERHLLYVACTRARDHLLVTGVAPVSEFLDDFTKGDRGLAAHQ